MLEKGMLMVVNSSPASANGGLITASATDEAVSLWSV